MTYMGQELALDHRPDLFERDPMQPEYGDREFERYFLKSMRAAKEAKQHAAFFSWSVGKDRTVYCLRSTVAASLSSPIDQALLKEGNYLLVARPEVEPTQETSAPSAASAALFGFEGIDLLSGEKLHVSEGDRLPERPAMLIRLGH